MTPLEVMTLHVRCLYRKGDSCRILAINQWDGGSVPRFHLSRTREGNLWRFRGDLGKDLVDRLTGYCRDEPFLDDPLSPPRYQRDYERLLGRQAALEAAWEGPAYAFLSPTPAGTSVAINSINAHLLRTGMADWLPDVAHRAPFMAAVEDGQAVAVCASVRITKAAHEAGVETQPSYRRKGHALDVVSSWANAVQALGALPLYSTSWDNDASQAVARRLGAIFMGSDYWLH